MPKNPIIPEAVITETISSKYNKRKTKAQNLVPEKISKIDSCSDIVSINSKVLENLSDFQEDSTQLLTALERLCHTLVNKIDQTQKDSFQGNIK